MTTKPHDTESITEHVARDDEAKRAGADEERAKIVEWVTGCAARATTNEMEREISSIAHGIRVGVHRRFSAPGVKREPR